MLFEKYQFTVTERFKRYVQIDTQSDPLSPTCPSTEKQKDLLRLLVEELRTMGLQDAEMDVNGYVYATIPATTEKNVPVICFCSHVDTAPDCSGSNVKPVVHENYRGGDITLPADTSQVIRVAEHPELKEQIGDDIITTDGTTLLGADDKAGVAEIMDAANFLMQHPELKHGKIRILFTPDEEIGRGADKADLKKLGADFAYTLDGGSLGTLENETFSADGVTVRIKGFSTHPGYAKNKMQHAIKMAAEVVAKIPSDKTPESTEKKQPFIHPTSINGSLEEAEIRFIIRAFDNATLIALEKELEEIVRAVVQKHNKSSYTFEVKEQYRNMKEILDRHPQVVDYARLGIERSGLRPILDSIRGGTDGSRFSFMGLPTANLFAGEHGIHSKQEWVSRQDMQKAVETIVNIASIWAEKS